MSARSRQTYFNVEVHQDDRGEWITEIKQDGEFLVCYGGINTQADAYLVGEAFLEGIDHILGEL